MALGGAEGARGGRAGPGAEAADSTTDPAVVRDALARLEEALCEGLPGAAIERAARQVTFRVGKRPFAYLLDNVHRDGVVAVCFKVTREEAAALAAEAPKRYFVPPYLGAHSWVAMRVDAGRVPWKELARRVTEGHGGAGAKKRG